MACTPVTDSSSAPPDLAQLRAPVAHELELVEGELRQVVNSAPELFDAIADQLVLRGKRLRPLTLLLCARVGPEAPAAVSLAVAVEEVHLASLLHDDVLDGAELRRGRPSAPAALGIRRAVLAGDYLAAAAYQQLMDLRDTEVVAALSHAVLRMTRAEVVATSAAGQLLSEAQYLDLISGKTAELFAAAAYLGAVAGHAPQETAEQLRSYGHDLGVAFQIRDDLLDLYGDSHRLGKPVGHDLAAGLYTLPVIHAAESAGGAALRERLVALRETPEEARLVEASAALTRELGGTQYAEQVMRRYAEQATAALPELPTRPALVGLAAYAVTRTR